MPDPQQASSDIRQAFENLANGDFSRYADEIKVTYQEEVFIVDAIDTGRFIQSIDYHQVESGAADVHSYQVDSSNDPLVTYDAFVEAGTVKMAARWPARRALEGLSLVETTDSLIRDAFDPIFN